jgi:non-ribosomal peptide synthetase component F
MNDIAGRIALLAPEKRALLAARLARSQRQLRGLQQLPSQERGVPAPLSYTQRSVWFLDQLYPGNIAYNSPIALRFTGRLNPEALEWSLNQVVRRHNLLRTVFEPGDGDPVQYAKPFGPVSLRRMEFGTLPESERMEAARKESVREAQKPFDLVSGPPWRAKLLCCSEREHVLVVILHHIICDGWSIGVLVRELIAGYEAFLRGENRPLPELPFQYSHYAVWQRQQLAGPEFQSQVELWRKDLEGLSGAIQVPLDKPRPAEPTFQGARLFTLLPPQLGESLRRIAHSEGATLFMVLLGAFKVLLSRYGGQSDVVVGSPFANRERREFEGLIGFFANTLALRTDLSGDPTFVELLTRVREAVLRAYDSQEIPFEKLVEELKPERQLNRNPFFDISFSLQNLPMPAVNVPDLSIDLLRVDNGTSKFDLSVVIVETQRGLSTTVEYSSDLFDASTAARLLRNYRTLLEGIAEDPRQKISRLPLLTETERERILVEWNATGVEYPRDRGIHKLFEEQVRRSPQAVAVVFGGRELSYAELDERSGRLARYLSSLGVGEGARVALCMEPSVEMIVGLLGILKVGAAYVPIDPKYPLERICFMLADSGAGVLLTRKGLLSRFSDKAVKSVCLDGDWEAMEGFGEAGQQQQEHSWVAEGGEVAYVLYTSGSTGTPKGVSVPHRAVNRLVVNSDYVQLGPEEVVAQISNCCFDAATFEIWGALLNGSRLVGIELERVLSAEAFSGELARHGVTTLFVTTALFNELVHERADIFSQLGNVLFGGEEADPGVVRKVLESGPPQRLLNVYGPTEATTFAN